MFVFVLLYFSACFVAAVVLASKIMGGIDMYVFPLVVWPLARRAQSSPRKPLPGHGASIEVVLAE